MSLVQWPTEQEAMAFGDLAAVANHVGVAQRVTEAFTLRVGALANSIGLMAALPVSVVQRGIAAARVITQPFVAARPQAQPPTPEVAEVSRNATPLEAVQVGTVWRICRRIVFTRNGRLWADTEALDVDPNAPAPAPPGRWVLCPSRCFRGRGVLPPRPPPAPAGCSPDTAGHHQRRCSRRGTPVTA